MSTFRDELLETLLTHSGQFVDIQDLIYKYCGTDTTFAPEDQTLIKCRLNLNLVLRELKSMEWILLSPQWGMSSAHMLNHETGRRYFVNEQRIQARLTTKGEVEYRKFKQDNEPKKATIHVGRDFKGNLNTGEIKGNQEYLEDALPINQHTSPPIKPQRNISTVILNWVITNPMIAAIIGGGIAMVIGTIILKHYHII